MGETDAQGMCMYIYNEVLRTRLLKGGYFGLRVGKEETTGELVEERGDGEHG